MYAIRSYYVLGSIRELLGSGSIFGVKLLAQGPFLLMILPPGAFITLGLLLATMNWFDAKRRA